MDGVTAVHFTAHHVDRGKAGAEHTPFEHFTYTIHKHTELKDVLFRYVFMYGNYEESKEMTDNSGGR